MSVKNGANVRFYLDSKGKVQTFAPPFHSSAAWFLHRRSESYRQKNICAVEEKEEKERNILFALFVTLLVIN